MDLKSIINKFTEGTKLLLVQPTMFFRELGDVSLKTMHTVTEDEAGRPDLIADKYYGLAIFAEGDKHSTHDQ